MPGKTVRPRDRSARCSRRSSLPPVSPSRRVHAKGQDALEFVVSAIRALRAAKADGSFTAQSDGVVSDPLNRMGSMKLFDRAEPDGYPEAAAPWISAGTLAERLRFVQALLIASGNPVGPMPGIARPTRSPCFGRKPPAQLTDAGAVVDYFLGVLYPAEGKANLTLYRASAENYLNSADNGVSPAAFSSLAPATTAYDQRVRGHGRDAPHLPTISGTIILCTDSTFIRGVHFWRVPPSSGWAPRSAACSTSRS